MNERHRQVQFPDPFEFEIDPERALWVPGRKKIFVPAPKKIESLWDTMRIDWGPFFSDRQRDFYERLCICVPGRSESISGRDFRVPMTYNDIQRSQVPAFRSRRW